MAETQTVNYGWIKPDVGVNSDTWGDEWNANLDSIDSIVHSISGGSAVPISQAVTVTGVNTFAPLAHAPLPNPITLMVNGRGFFSVGTPPDFSVSGNTITWLSAIYSVSPGDKVVALYFYTV
jgi:hypothetical protein